MMAAGRPRKPSATKRLENNPGKRRINDAEPTPPLGIPARPDWLPKGAKKFWDLLTKVLDDMGVLTTADAVTVAMMADALAEWSAARKYTDKNGSAYTTVTPSGSKMRRATPEVAQAADAMRRFNSLAGQFGLTPAQRSKLVVPAKGEVDPLDELRERRQRKEAKA